MMVVRHQRNPILSNRSDPLPPISRIEARSYAHLLDPPPTTSTSSPLGPGSVLRLRLGSRDSPAARTARRRPPLRALELRRALAAALAETLEVLERATADLNALLPRDSPLLDLVPTKPPRSPAAVGPFPPCPSSSSSSSSSSSESGSSSSSSSDTEFEPAQKGRRRKGSRRQHEHGKASIAEMLRHEERARREREELDRFNYNHDHEDRSGSGFGSGSKAGARSVEEAGTIDDAAAAAAAAAAADPFHPTESTFGGIERRRFASVGLVEGRRSASSSPAPAGGTAPAAAGPAKARSSRRGARLRDSLTSLSFSPSPSPFRTRQRPAASPSSSCGAEESDGESVAATAGTTTTTTTTPPSRSRSDAHKRTGGGRSSLSSILLRPDDDDDDDDAASSSRLARPASPSPSFSDSDVHRDPHNPDPDPDDDDDPDAKGSPVPYLLVSLQDAFDDVHALRRGVIWRLLEALAASESGRTWNAIAGVVGMASLAGRMRDVASEVARAHEREFDAAAAATAGTAGPGLDAGRSSAGGKGPKSDGKEAEQEAREREREKRRRRSGAFARELLHDNDDDDAAAAVALDRDRRNSLDFDIAAAHGDGDDGARLARRVATAGRGGDAAVARREETLGRLTSHRSSSSSKSPSAININNNQPTPPPPRRVPASYADFAPPSSSSALSNPGPLPPSSTTRGSDSLRAHVRGMVLALRAVEAKLKFVVDECVAPPPPLVTAVSLGDEQASTVLEMYRGIGVDLKRFEEQWRGGTECVEQAVGLGPAAATAAAVTVDVEEGPALDPVPMPPVRDIGGVDDDDEEEEERNRFGARDAVLLQTEEAGPDADDPIANRQALVDAALSASLLPPSSSSSSTLVDATAADLSEKVFEAVVVAGPAAADGTKLSREERIRRMKEAREALARGRESLGSSPVKTRSDDPEAMGGGGGTCSLAQQQKMVGELQEVLREYNRERGRNVGPTPDSDGPDLLPRTPPRPAPVRPSPAQLPRHGLPPPVPFSVAVGTVASPPPLAPPLPPPPGPPPASTKQQQQLPPPTTPQKALPPHTPPRSGKTPLSPSSSAYRPTPPRPPPQQQSPLSQKGTPSASSSRPRYSVQSV
ncbi:hypothetical protein JCM3774_004227 [Rhodotorula dairenensis]